MADLVSHLVPAIAYQTPQAQALTYQDRVLTYAELAERISQVSSAYLALGLKRGERIGIYMEKRFENVVSMFSAAAAGGVFVPVNPLLKPDQVAYILRDCNVRILVTTIERLKLLAPVFCECPDLRAVIIAGTKDITDEFVGLTAVSWDDALGSASDAHAHRIIDTDMAAIFYTSGSTGKPKGVVLSHRNIVAGAKSVAQYLENKASDRILSALPLSFDAGFSQLTTAFHSGACVTLINYLLPRDVLDALVREEITGLTAVPPLWIQLAHLDWPSSITGHLRYIANTGGRMPKATLDRLRAHLPKTKPFLMYGLTEAFRSTYLPPEEVDRRPDSIGKAIPNAEILVLRDDGTQCSPNEPGELVHRGALVGMGYWNDAEKTAERYKSLPVGIAGREPGLVLPELAVYSGDTVRMDEEGFLYFIGRRDEMMKTSGYRVSPTEVEEVVYATGMVAETAALGVPHPVLGHAIVLVATPTGTASLDTDKLLAECRKRLPTYMVPALIKPRAGSLPRNPNGKIDRKLLAQELDGLFESQS